MTQARHLIGDVLMDSGIEHVFGIPGGGTIKIYDALYNHTDKIKTILSRHEQGAACMADMYGRLTGKPALLMGQGAFIGSSGAFGIIEALLSSSPMLVITDVSDDNFMQHGRYQCGGGEYGSFDLLSILRSISKYTTMATTPKEAVYGVQLAIKHAVSGRPGPACVLLKSSSITGEVDNSRAPYIHKSPGYHANTLSVAPLEDIEQAANILGSAQKPVIVAGNGVHISRAYNEIAELAECLAAPVTTSYNGKSCISENQTLSIGMMGMYGQEVTNTILGEADVVLVVGCCLSPTDTCYENPKVIDPNRQRIIQIDIEPKNAGWSIPIELGLIGDAKAILKQLVEFCRDFKTPDEKKQTNHSLMERKKNGSYFENPKMHDQGTPILPQAFVKTLQNALPPETIFTLDAGNNRVWFTRFFKAQMPGTIFSPSGIAGMGWGAPAALAAKIVYPGRPCVCVNGDGGFMMSLHVLSTAIQYELPVIFIVMNNAELGMVRHGQGDRRISSEFKGDDFARIAESFGCRGMRVDNPRDFSSAVKEALASSQPTVIDALINKDENFEEIKIHYRSQ